MQIYQIVCYAIAYDKQLNTNVVIYPPYHQIYVGDKGLNEAKASYRKVLTSFKNTLTMLDKNRYTDIVGKCELNEPVILKNGSIALWGDVIFTKKASYYKDRKYSIYLTELK